MNNILKIDLTDYRGKNSTSLTGRPQGKQVRKELELDSQEGSYNFIEVYIPIGTTSFNPSFFLGLFFKSIQKLSTVDNFLAKFTFLFHENESEILKELIEDNIDEALVYAQNALEDSNRGYLSF